MASEVPALEVASGASAPIQPDFWAQTQSALRANFIPALVLWCTGTAILIAWRFVPAAHAGLEAVGRLKAAYGFTYSIIGMALFAGVIPFLMQRLVHPDGRPVNPVRLALLIGFWAAKGAEIDAFYRLQSHLFGDGADAASIIAKLAFDQCLYAPLWAIPSMTLGMAWIQHPRRGILPPGMTWSGWCRGTLPTALLINAFVSIPGVAIIYAMPPALQIPVQNLVICLFVTVLLFITRDQRSHHNAAEQDSVLGVGSVLRDGTA